METIEATYRVVTPMFMSGADQSKAELRLASIKGALRFWWRALAWGRLNGDLAAIRKEENILFGSTDNGYGQAGVLMKLGSTNVSTKEANVNEDQWKPNTWQHYSGYGLVAKKTATNPYAREKREYIEAGSQFTLQVSAQNIDVLYELGESLKLLGLLGGLGARSRNGWGSVTLENIKRISNNLNEKIWLEPKSVEELYSYFEILFQSSQESGKFTSLSNQANFKIGKTFKNANQAQKSIAGQYKTFIANMRGQDKLYREGFGLPRKLTLRHGSYQNEQLRRSGAVFLHVHEFVNKEACPVVAVLPAQFHETIDEPEGSWDVAVNFLSKVQE